MPDRFSAKLGTSGNLKSSDTNKQAKLGVSSGLKTPGLKTNFKGDVTVAGGLNPSKPLSVKGEVSLGVDIGGKSIKPSIKGEAKIVFPPKIEIPTIEIKKEGCTTTIIYKILAVIVNTSITIDPDCEKKEPISKPNPKDEDDIKKGDKGVPPQPSGPDPVPYPLVPGKTYGIMYEASEYYDGSAIADLSWANSGQPYWFLPTSANVTPETVGSHIIPIFNRLSATEKQALYEVLGTGWTFAPWITKNTPIYTVPSTSIGLAGYKYLGGITVEWWLAFYGGSNFEPNYFIPNQLTRAYYVWHDKDNNTGLDEGWNVKITDFPVGPTGREKWFPGTPNAKIVEIPPLKPRPKTNTPTRTPMSDDCCEETKELLNDVYDLLGGDKFRDDGLEIPNHLFIPGGTGETKALTYNALLNLMFRTLDHRTVGEVEVSIKDNNIMKEGDQGLTMKLVNATAATGKILELSQKQDSDLTAVLNLLMRLSWISVQILKVVNIGSEATKTIVSFFAIPVKEKVINVDIPVDPSLGGKIGFDPKKPSEDQLIKILDLDDPQKTISIFDKFMNNSKIPVKVKQFIGDRSGGNYWWLMDKNKK
jgi:hypothetical protein